ncbi:alternative ribosome rescue aminoacyl-tRNA hydrolase ArfB [Flagellimonas flava]|uniref:Ribosome-associated protein n=1 Tax=Flagellimonas flava TaxID=570519 RepID=A0A1M5KV57_9FLAO|nr:alternative ribosome rescue aminoacyl-tRNA hydrolase ArfB [Allomuricauda flava]SHG56615.1 ribosome-associated protein [Allomuricauda flava]
MNQEQIQRELEFKAIRSSGAGGQHVNKVSSKVELSFSILLSDGLSSLEKERLLHKLGTKITKDAVMVLQCDTSRSQHKNKQIVVKRFFELVQKALKVPKKRKPTKPSKAAVEKRLKLKRKASDKKVNRQKPKWD